MKSTKFLNKDGNHKFLSEDELIEISAILKIGGDWGLADRVIDHLTRVRFMHSNQKKHIK